MGQASVISMPALGGQRGAHALLLELSPTPAFRFSAIQGWVVWRSVQAGYDSTLNGRSADRSARASVDAQPAASSETSGALEPVAARIRDVVFDLAEHLLTLDLEPYALAAIGPFDLPSLPFGFDADPDVLGEDPLRQPAE